jgi:hypothetical protein
VVARPEDLTGGMLGPNLMLVLNVVPSSNGTPMKIDLTPVKSRVFGRRVRVVTCENRGELSESICWPGRAL